jgi:arabinoxylan arabinofuranohydrolase
VDDIDPAVFIDDDGQAYLYWGNTVMKWAKLKPNMVELDGPIHTVGLDQFTEAAYLHKHKGTYYLSYSRQFPEETVYMTAIHHAIVDFNGKSYIFYHNGKLPTGGEFRRSAAVEELRYTPDGKIVKVPQTAAGPAANPSPGCK